MAPTPDTGYVEGRSDNLPKVDGYMLMEFAATSEDFISAEIRNIKTDRAMRESYTSSAIGRVYLKRSGKFCTVKAEVCPEHKQHSANYHVEMTVDEDNEVVTDLGCTDWAASEGGCKHGLAFLMWMHEKSSEPSPTDITSYWNKPRLSKISTNTVATTKDFGEVVGASTSVNVGNFFAKVLARTSQVVSTFQGYNSPIDDVNRLDLHQLCIQYVHSNISDEATSASVSPKMHVDWRSKRRRRKRIPVVGTSYVTDEFPHRMYTRFLAPKQRREEC